MPNILGACWFFEKNLSYFVSNSWKLDNPYCHYIHFLSPMSTNRTSLIAPSTMHGRVGNYLIWNCFASLVNGKKNSFCWHEQRKYQWFFSTYLFDRENVHAVVEIICTLWLWLWSTNTGYTKNWDGFFLNFYQFSKGNFDIF